MARDLLVEIGVEELPSGLVLPLAEQLATNMEKFLHEAKLNFDSIKFFGTPRRLAVLVRHLEENQQAQVVEKRGPACSVAHDEQGNPTKALLGFAKSVGVDVSQLQKLITDKGEWWSYQAEISGKATQDILPELISLAIKKLSIPKPMRWGSSDESFARPVHWLVSIFGGETIEFELFGIKSGNQTRGHRFHSPKPIAINVPNEYEDILAAHFVVADFTKRRDLIREKACFIASTKNADPIMPDALLDEVTSIVEYPNILIASFPKEFLSVPKEALVAAMQVHQKCFPIQDENGNLLPYFVTVSNIASKSENSVILGNEKVMNARLQDARFFYELDKKMPLEAFVPMTDKVIFQEKLGTLKDKAERVAKILNILARELSLNKSNAKRAAFLAKADLMTSMVGEFPELQGLMGYYYAKAASEDDEVAKALDEQYKPRFSEDELPKSELGMALSLAERLDTLVSIFAIGKKPTGMKDPFKLRRHGRAISRLLRATNVALSLDELIVIAIKGLPASLKTETSLEEDVKAFILDRLQSLYLAEGIPQSIIKAALARQDDCFYDLDKRVKALLDFTKLTEAESLSGTCKRVSNILQQANLSQTELINAKLLKQDAEIILHEEMLELEERLAKLYENLDYNNSLQALADLKEPVDQFFASVMVMVDDEKLRTNRLMLLKNLQTLCNGVADISLLA